MPRRRKAGTEKNRIALLHALAHIELNAIDLAWDMVARFGASIAAEMRADFLADWIGVAADEAKHFSLLESRLNELDAAYGDLPAHDGLWQAALDTADDLAARLAIVPLVLEARGLDVTPQMIDQFAAANDEASAYILKIIYEEEIGHVRAGYCWFAWLCQRDGRDPAERFRELLEVRFKGRLKPPFNEAARAKTGMNRAFYTASPTD